LTSDGEARPAQAGIQLVARAGRERPTNGRTTLSSLDSHDAVASVHLDASTTIVTRPEKDR
jgi:hypothetical protein